MELFLTDFYLFNLSPLVIDIKNIAGEGLREIPPLENGKVRLPHQWIESLIFERLRDGGYIKDWERRIGQLDEVNGYEGLMRMMPIMDQLAEISNPSYLNTIYQFNGNQLQPIHAYK